MLIGTFKTVFKQSKLLSILFVTEYCIFLTWKIKMCSLSFVEVALLILLYVFMTLSLIFSLSQLPKQRWFKEVKGMRASYLEIIICHSVMVMGIDEGPQP